MGASRAPSPGWMFKPEREEREREKIDPEHRKGVQSIWMDLRTKERERERYPKIDHERKHSAYA